MGDNNAIVSLGELSKPATVLIRKISEAVGGIFKPYQLVRLARAEAEADRIRAESQIEIEDLHRRALHRFLEEEARKQRNIEEVTRKAIPELGDGARPDDLESDWLANFFDKCRLTSDPDMQELWARILAGEATSPGTFARRTVNFVGSLDKTDAEEFTALCSFCWVLPALVPLVFDVHDPVYSERGVTFAALTHLESIGLIRFEASDGFRLLNMPEWVEATYHERVLQLRLPKTAENHLNIGHVMLTRMGAELAPICGSQAHPEFFAYVQDRWKGHVSRATAQEKSQVAEVEPPGTG